MYFIVQPKSHFYDPPMSILWQDCNHVILVEENSHDFTVSLDLFELQQVFSVNRHSGY